MSRNPALFGFGQHPNLVGRSSSTVSVPAPYEAAGLPATNAQTEEPSEVSRILTNNPEFTYWNASFQSIFRTVSGMAGINSNLSPNGYYRFLGAAIGGGTLATPAYQYDAPSTVVLGINASGAVTDVDEAISAPDANFIEPVDTALKWNCRFTFPTPSPTPNTGPYMAAFVVRVLAVNGGATTLYPRLTAELFESAVLIRELGSRAVSVSTGDGQLFIFPFNPSELSASNLSNVEVRILCSAGVGLGAQYAKLNTVALLTDTTTVGLYPLDSGWIRSPAAYYADAEDGPVPQLSFDYFPTTESDVDNLLLLVMDDQAVADPIDADGGADNQIPISIIRTQPPGYVDLGMFAAGPALVLERGPRTGPESSVVVEGYEGVTEGGQTYGADAFRRRRMSVVLTLNRTEKDVLMNGIDWRRGRSGAFYVNLDPDLALENREFVAGWVTVEEAGAAVQMPGIAYDAGDLMLYTKAYVLDEKL